MSPAQQHYDKESEACRVVIEFSTEIRHQLPAIIDDLVASGRDPQLFAHVDAELIPSEEKVVEIIHATRRLLFPGYFNGQALDENQLQYATGMEVNRLFETLSAEIALSIKHDCQRYDLVCTRCQERGQEEAINFLR